MSTKIKALIATILAAAVFTIGCDNGKKIDRRGPVAYEFSFEATSTQRDEYLSGLEGIADKFVLDYTRDHLTEQAIRDQEHRTVRIAYLSKTFKGDHILVASISDLSSQSGFVVQIYSGTLSESEISSLKSALLTLMNATKK